MNKKNIPILFFASLGLIVILYLVFTYDDGKHFQWNESYQAKSDQPYGTLFTKKLLENYRDGGSFRYNDNRSLKQILHRDSAKADTDYILIAQRIHLDEGDVEALAAFIESGNDAFIATLTPPEQLLTRLYAPECDESIYYDVEQLDSIYTDFYHESIKHPEDGWYYRYRFQTDDVPYFWHSFNQSIFCDSTRNITPLGYQTNGQVNFIKIAAGKGNLYLHTNPLLFTNYFLIHEDKVDYVANVFSHLSGTDMIWDEYSKSPYLNNSNPYDSPLYFILAQPSLKYAWWMFLITVLLYVLFAAKRTQRAIPVLEPKTNSSLEYVNLISSLHYQNGNNLDMARKKMRYFQYFIRSKYGIQVTAGKDDHIARLAQKSQIDPQTIRNIFHQFNLIEKNSYSNIEANRLLDFYYSIDNFYRNCK